MLTRKIAIARLRAQGTLNDGPRDIHRITAKPGELEFARAVAAAVAAPGTAAQSRPGNRWFAPAESYTVLP
jgi:hypothetical protein